MWFRHLNVASCLPARRLSHWLRFVTPRNQERRVQCVVKQSGPWTVQGIGFTLSRLHPSPRAKTRGPAGPYNGCSRYVVRGGRPRPPRFHPAVGRPTRPLVVPSIGFGIGRRDSPKKRICAAISFAVEGVAHQSGTPGIGFEFSYFNFHAAVFRGRRPSRSAVIHRQETSGTWQTGTSATHQVLTVGLDLFLSGHNISPRPPHCHPAPKIVTPDLIRGRVKRPALLSDDVSNHRSHLEFTSGLVGKVGGTG